MGEKKIFSTRVDEDRVKDLKHLSVDTGRSLGNLLEEAIRDLIVKHRMSGAETFLSVDTSGAETFLSVDTSELEDKKKKR
jgi:uncharacterized protein YfdQ (DUF2303 family)